MELIKQIKEAEARAKQIVEDAHAQAGEIAAQAKNKSEQMLSVAQKQRSESIAQSTEQGLKQGQEQGQILKDTGSEQIKQLQENARAQMPAAIDSVAAAVTALAQDQ